MTHNNLMQARYPMSANVLPTGALPQLTEQELSGMKVWQLEKLLQDKGLAKRGKKNEKIRRYLEAQANGFQPKPVATSSERMAKSRKRKSQQQRQESNANDAKRMAQARADEKENIWNLQPSFDGTMVWEEPGEDYTLDRHEESPETAAILFGLNNGSYAGWKLEWLVAYIHFRNRLKKEDNVTALQQLDSLYLLSVERHEPFDKTTCQIFDKPFMRHARNLQEELGIIEFEEAQLEMYVNKSISIEQLKEGLDPPSEIDTNNLKAMYDSKWMESLVGLRLNVKQYWWVDPDTQKSIRGETLWPGEIDIGTDDDGNRFFVFKCDDENYPELYRIEYCDIKKYADKEHPDFSNFILREEPLVNKKKDFQISCEETLQELREFDGKANDALIYILLLVNPFKNSHSFVLFFFQPVPVSLRINGDEVSLALARSSRSGGSLAFSPYSAFLVTALTHGVISFTTMQIGSRVRLWVSSK